MKFSNLNIFWAFVVIMLAFVAGGFVMGLARMQYAKSKKCPGCGGEKPATTEEEVVTTGVDTSTGQPTIMRSRY